MLKRYRSSPGPIAPCDPGAARQWPFGKLWPSCSPIRKDNWALCGFARNQRNYSCEPRCRRHHCRQYPVRRQPDIVGSDDDDTAAHKNNFFDCVRNRKEPNCPFELGYNSAIACQMAIASLRQGRTVQWDPEKNDIV